MDWVNVVKIGGDGLGQCGQDRPHPPPGRKPKRLDAKSPDRCRKRHDGNVEALVSDLGDEAFRIAARQLHARGAGGSRHPSQRNRECAGNPSST